MKPIPYGKQFISPADVEAVTKALQSDYLTQGPAIKGFEDAFARYVGVKYAVAVANGTAALHLATLALGVGNGDKVITTPISFSATANAIRYAGGEVVFADINPSSLNLDVSAVRHLLRNSPPETFKGLIPVDFGGLPVNLEEFRNLAEEFGLWIIEDACHAPGGYFFDSQARKSNCGSGQYADLGIFSFHPVKHIAAGEGGMITTNDTGLYEKLLLLRTHGITRDSASFVNPVSVAAGTADATTYPQWYMEMQDLGFNYRLTDIQAALALSQLGRADQGLIRRHEIAKRYNEAFRGQHNVVHYDATVDLSGHAYHLYVVRVRERLKLYEWLRARNVLAQIHYIPIHYMPYYQSLGWKVGDFPVAEQYYKECMSLPMYPTLTDDEQNYVIQSILDFYA